MYIIFILLQYEYVFMLLQLRHENLHTILICLRIDDPVPIHDRVI